MIICNTDIKTWESFKNTDEFSTQSLVSEGFIHCCSIGQILNILNKKYKDRKDILLMIIDETRVRSKVVFEDLKDKGENYPHIYGTLNMDAIVETFVYPCDDSGSYSMKPELMKYSYKSTGRIEHLALYTSQLEVMKDFYVEYFNGVANERYINETKGFESYFITLGSGSRLELMSIANLEDLSIKKNYAGLHHFAISIGSEDKVNELTKHLYEMGYDVESNPRRTGDGYYESVILDPDGNRVEITA